MRYTHSFIVHAPLAVVADFHSRSASMAAITPFPIRVQVHRAPERLSEGDEMDFTLWLGLLPVRWLARFEDVTAGSFVDRQLSGPFETWRHTHRYEAIETNRTRVNDEIEVQLRRHPFWRLFGLSLWFGLPLLFAYRGWQTRRQLSNPSGVFRSQV